MKEKRLSNNNNKLLDAILDSFIDLDPTTPEEIDNELLSIGLNPDEMDERIENIVRDALARSPFNWRVKERVKIEEERRRYRQVEQQERLSRADIVYQIQQLFSKHGGQFAAAHRNLNEVSDEDLASLLSQLKFLSDAEHEEE